MSSISGESYTCWTSSRDQLLPGCGSTADASVRTRAEFGAVHGRGELAGVRERTAPRREVKSVRGAADMAPLLVFFVGEEVYGGGESRSGENFGAKSRHAAESQQENDKDYLQARTRVQRLCSGATCARVGCIHMAVCGYNPPAFSHDPGSYVYMPFFFFSNSPGCSSGMFLLLLQLDLDIGTTPGSAESSSYGSGL